MVDASNARSRIGGLLFQWRVHLMSYVSYTIYIHAWCVYAQCSHESLRTHRFSYTWVNAWNIVKNLPLKILYRLNVYFSDEDVWVEKMPRMTYIGNWKRQRERKNNEILYFNGYKLSFLCFFMSQHIQKCFWTQNIWFSYHYYYSTL